MMQPLRIEARLVRAIVNPGRPIALDALLAYAAAMKLDLVQPMKPDEIEPIELPLERSKCGRYWMASFSEQVVEERDRAYIVRRPLINEMIDLGADSIKTVHIGAGPNKGYRIPIELGHLVDDRLTWWCIGNADGVKELLSRVHYLGKRRAVGRGKIREWIVGPCEPWGDGFPVARDGRALRNLPADYAGITDPRLDHQPLTPPYWMRERAEEVFAP